MKNKWISFIVLYFSALCVSLSQLKIVTLLGDLSQSMNLTMTQASWLMSVFTVAGIIMAIPGGALLGKLGPKNLLLSLLAFLFAGNLLGAFSTGNYVMLLISRMLEGVSFALIVMTGVVMISQWFAGGKVGLAIGIFTTFPATGSVIALNVSAPIAARLGLSSLWIIIAVLTVLAFLLDIIVLKVPRPEGSEAVAPPPTEKPSLPEALSNPRAWLVAISHGCVAFVLFAFITFYPQIFSGLYGLDPGTANFYASLNGLFGIPFCIISGFIIDRLKNTSLLVIISYVCLAAVCFFTTKLGPSTYVLHTLLTALFTGMIIPANVAIAPSVAKRPALIAYSVALLNFVYFIGNFAGVPAVSAAIESSGWQSGMNVLTLASAVGAIIMVIFMALDRKKA